MDNLHIFFALNDSYTSHYCVTMVSVLTNTPNRHCHFYLLTDYISEKNKRRFSQVEEQYANCSIHYQLITEKIFDSFHRNIDYLVSPVSYYRYIIPELYPQLDKALYLDGDLVVNGSLENLWDTDITDYLCAGVHDLWIENINYKPQIVEIQAALRIGTLPNRPGFRSSRVVNDGGFVSFLGMLDSVLGREVIPFGQLFDSAAAYDIDDILVLELYLFSQRDSCFT